MSGNEKAPSVAALEASDNVNRSRKNVMSDNSTNVIPFNFGEQQVRTLLIAGEPWFVAADVCRVLEVGNTTQAVQALDEDERSMFNIGRQGQANLINESGLYTLILRCRDAVKKGSKPHAFRKWVAAEVLPSIRKTGRYEDKLAKMPTLVDELIGMSELSVIKGLIRDKAKSVPANMRQSFAMTMHGRLHTRFNVPRTELIPAGQFESACNFIAAYALEGEYIEAQPKHGVALDQHETHHLYLLMSRFAAMFKHKNDMLAASRALGSTPLMGIFEQLKEGDRSFEVLDRRRAEIYGAYSATGCQGGYAWRAVA